MSDHTHFFDDGERIAADTEHTSQENQKMTYSDNKLSEVPYTEPESSNSQEGRIELMTTDLFETKRYLYHILEERLSVKVDIAKGESRPSFTILGPRRVGKTIILKQLEAHFSTVSKYIDCSTLKEDIDYDAFLRDLYERGTYLILLDEISKIPYDRICAFTSAVKNHCGIMSFVLTGSTKLAVSRLSGMIGRSDNFELPPIMYIERLAWKYNENVYNIESYRSTISLESFRNYVEHFAVVPDASGLDYVRSIVDDTLQSVWKSNYLDEDGRDVLKLSEDDHELLIKYISLCQLVYSLRGRAYCDIPSLSEHIQDIMGRLYKVIKTRQGMPKAATAQMCQLLIDSGLAVEIYIKYDVREDLPFRCHQIDKEVPNIIFEYPWYASAAIDNILDTETMWGFWIENLLFLKMRYAYRFVDKYRFGNSEIDIIYMLNDIKYCGLECKFRPRKQLSDKMVADYQHLAHDVDLVRMDLTCTESNEQYDEYTHFYKIHELIAALELEYIHLDTDTHASVSVLDLMKRYGFL